ncbi:MAG TPA: arabinan endo-1,5-alpha-L-arabinosidase [Verrucomicrobiae bacterium]|nr:arabinan endo-1,5-alpha-L-arabinosidase [Verrucomicrobiae bacterium]
MPSLKIHYVRSLCVAVEQSFRIATIAALVFAASASAQTASNAPSANSNPAGRQFATDSRRVRAHDPSTIIKDKDRYWVFHTGRGVMSYYSTNLVNWLPGPRVFTDPPEWVSSEVPENRNSHFWAPDIIHLNGEYHLYYSVSSFGKNHSVIALATNPALDPDDPSFKWSDRGVVMRSFSTNRFNAIDPALIQDKDGKVWMSFGSFWSGIKMIELDPKTGKRIAPDSALYSLARTSEIEAPFIHRHGDAYYLFVNWGICCRGVNSTYEIRVGKSDRITGPYVDADGKDLADGGGTLVLKTADQFIGPGHAGIFVENGTHWFGCHYYDGSRRGAPTFSLHPLQWVDGWPRVQFTAPSASVESANP